jgi:hypothetical protein
MIEESTALIERHQPKIAKAGLLAALAAIRSKLFQWVL